MRYVKSYVTPCITVVIISETNILRSSSDYETMMYTCSEFCKLWHICQDRKKDKFCRDMKLKDFLSLIQDEEARIELEIDEDDKKDYQYYHFGLVTFIQTLILLNTI